jgi:hypothetical protein
MIKAPNNSANISSMIQTALWPLTDVIRDKQALKFGIEVTTTQGALLTLTVDSENNTSPIYTLQNYVQWINNLSIPINWTNTPWLSWGGSIYGLVFVIVILR